MLRLKENGYACPREGYACYDALTAALAIENRPNAKFSPTFIARNHAVSFRGIPRARNRTPKRSGFSRCYHDKFMKSAKYTDIFHSLIHSNTGQKHTTNKKKKLIKSHSYIHTHGTQVAHNKALPKCPVNSPSSTEFGTRSEYSTNPIQLSQSQSSATINPDE